jgi:multiple sugar transport system permease protein
LVDHAPLDHADAGGRHHLEIVAQFQLFGQALLLTRGGPNNTSRPIVLFIYETGFRDWNLGYAAAASEVLFLLMAIAAMAQYVVSRRKEA